MCIRSRRSLSALLDGEASASEVEAVARHLGSCPSCRRFAARIAVVTRELKSVSVDRGSLSG
jgi:anti-sigma factor RsiW